MDKLLLKEAQARFIPKIEDLTKHYNGLNIKRKKFVSDYNEQKLKKLAIEDYVIGKKEKAGFSYRIETELEGLGSISGTTAIKFGVYFGLRDKKKILNQVKKYHYTQKLEVTNEKDAFSKIKTAILEVLEAGKRNDIESLVRHKILAPTFKGKILSIYFPNKFLNVYSEEFLNHYLNKFNLLTPELLKSDPIIKRQRLLEFKESDEVMKDWSVEIFSDFLHNEIGAPTAKNIYGAKGKKKGNAGNNLIDYADASFPDFQELVEIELEMIPNASNEGNEITQKPPRSGDINGVGKGNPDYSKQLKKNKEYGDKGEELVERMEKERVSAFNSKLGDKVRRVSEESNSYGYDIISFESDGSERQIEVKATNAKKGDANFFLTESEYRKAKSFSNYFIYVVYEIESEKPQLWKIKNPFMPVNNSVKMVPNVYRVSIKTK